MLPIIDNKTYKFGDDLKEELKLNSRLQVCSAIFSMYGYQALKKELEGLHSLKFIFNDPTFIRDASFNKEQKEFQINSNKRIKSIAGTEFEVTLKNELTGRAIAEECTSWIKRKVQFKSSVDNKRISEFINVINDSNIITYLNTSEFSSSGFGYEKDNSLFYPITKVSDNFEHSKRYIETFNSIWESEQVEDVTNEVVKFISELYKENSPELIYYITLYNIFNEFLEDISEDELANEKTGFKESTIWNTLYDFQKDAVLGIINKLERHNGCILADSVGLGKTFTALAVVKYYQERNKSVLVLCPKKLAENWNTYKSNYKDNILQNDRFNYDVLFHTDLSRVRGSSNGMDLTRINWANYDLVVIDESHNFRNNSARKDRETRYERLMNEVMKSGVKTKVLMLSATPVNNRFLDLKNQLALAYEGRTDKIDEKISPTKSIDTILKNAQIAFNEWAKLEAYERTSESLLRRLNVNFDFFKLLDSVTIARSRKHIEKYYDIESIGKFSTRLKPISKSTEITDLNEFLSIKEIAESLMKLNMSVYSPFDYILDSKLKDYEEKYDMQVKDGQSSFKQADRERSLKILMRINLLKRLESSVEAFRITLSKIIVQIEKILMAIENFENNGTNSTFDELLEVTNYNPDEDIEEIIEDEFSIGSKVKIDLRDMNTIGWKEDLKHDVNMLKLLLSEMHQVTPEHDLKLKELIKLISEKVENPINPGNKKVIIFSAFADTANYLYRNVSLPLKQTYNLDTAKITGGGTNDCTLNINKDFNNLLMNFSPKSKHRDLLQPNSIEEIEILIATDCISEGQNLQDCDYLINYDIHWNPVKIIQRFGRIDRIGSDNEVIQLVNFWPNMNLDDYINLKNRVENKMLMLDISGTGEDNVLTNKSSDMEYRKEQLKKLKEEVVDLEDMNTGISITDLGLNDFRMDLVEYVNLNGDLSKIPNGMHSVVFADSDKGFEKGVIYILKNINNGINIDNMNQLHPFYLVYIKADGSIFSNHLNVKNTLDILRSISKGNIKPIEEAYMKFNNETDDGKNMINYSRLLNSSIDSIINIKEENDIDSLFRSGGTTMLKNNINGLEDFELITFMVVI